MPVYGTPTDYRSLAAKVEARSRERARVQRTVAVFEGDCVQETMMPLVGTSGPMVSVLTCNCADYQRTIPESHCKHIKEVIHRGLDGQVGREKFDLPPVVMVPITFKPWLCVPVSLGKGPMPDSRSVGLGEHIGFIFRGQGRMALRTLVLDWLIEQSIHLPECQADWHYQSLPWEEVGFDSRNPHHLCHLADLIMTGICRTCNDDNGVPDV